MSNATRDDTGTPGSPESPETPPTDTKTRLNKPVFFGSSIGIIGILVWVIVAPDSATDIIGALVGWV